MRVVLILSFNSCTFDECTSCDSIHSMASHFNSANTCILATIPGSNLSSYCCSFAIHILQRLQANRQPVLMASYSGSATRNLRKGAHSCVECRKRKLRCSRSSETAQSCRRCEERFLACIPQTVSSPSTSKPVRKTRDQVASLEEQVQHLTEVVQALQDPSGSTDPGLASQYSASNSEAGETDTCSEIAIPTQPSYLNALFNNSILNSSDSHPKSGSTSVSLQLSRTTRAALQSLVPDRETIISLAKTSSGWLSVLHDMFPIMTDIKSGVDIVARYEEVLQPTANPLTVASWLLVVAVTAQHSVGPHHQVKVRNRSPLTGPGYSRLVADSVERIIITRDQAVTSIEGIAPMTLLVRL